MARKKATARDLVDSLFQEYRRVWRIRHGGVFDYTPVPVHVRKAAAMIRENGIRACERAMREFVLDEDEWLAKNKHPIGYFLKYPDRFIWRSRGKDQERRRIEEETSRKTEREREDFEAFERSLGPERAGKNGGSENLRHIPRSGG